VEQGSSDSDSDSDSDTTDDGTRVGSFSITFYWVEREEDHSGNQTFSIQTYDSTSNTTSEIDTARETFVEAASTQGNGLLTDGTIISYQDDCSGFVASTVPYGVCFEIVNVLTYPYGRSREGTALSPYRGVAVGTSSITNGTELYIPLLDEVEMPGTEGGFTHDGCVTADDTGAGSTEIKLFVYRESNYDSLNETLGSSATYTSYIYTDSPHCD